jgi:hypothetical protein
MTVHLLHEGRTLCGSPSGIPKDWPDGHRWMSIAEHKMMLDKAGASRVDCDSCLFVAFGCKRTCEGGRGTCECTAPGECKVLDLEGGAKVFNVEAVMRDRRARLSEKFHEAGIRSPLFPTMHDELLANVRVERRPRDEDLASWFRGVLSSAVECPIPEVTLVQHDASGKETARYRLTNVTGLPSRLFDENVVIEADEVAVVEKKP